MKAKSKPKSKIKSVFSTIFYILGLLVWASAAIIVSQIILGFILAKILGVAILEQPLWIAIYYTLSCILAVALIILPSIKTIRRTKLGLRDTPTWTDIGLAPAGFIIYFLLAIGLITLFNFFPWFNMVETQDVGFDFVLLRFLSGSDRVVAFIALALVAPITEEIIFRGWLYGKIREKLSINLPEKASIAISILLVSLLFSIVHEQWNVGVDVFAMSIILCGMREITGTIYSGILMHMLKNGIAFYGLLFGLPS